MNTGAIEAQKTTLWDPSFESDACGMGFVAQIDEGFDQKLIHTVRGAGYVMREEA